MYLVPVASGSATLGLVGVVFVALLGLGGRVVVAAARAEGLVRAVHAGGLHGRAGGAGQQVGEAAQRRQRVERPQRAALAEQLRERDGRGQRATAAAARARRPALQIRLLKLHTAGAGQDYREGQATTWDVSTHSRREHPSYAADPMYRLRIFIPMSYHTT